MTDAALSALSGATNQQASAQTQAGKTSLAGDFNSFLTLLTTQLKNQDPLSPMDPSQFTQQLVGFAQVEQQLNTNTDLDKLVGIQNASLASSIIGFVGTDVEANGDGGLPLQNGSAKFTYNLSDNAKNVVITVTDDTGKVMFTKAGEITKGDHEVDWDGKDQLGAQAPDGQYHVSVTPVGFDGATAPTVTTKVFGHITGVSMDNGTTLMAGETPIPLDKIISITDPNS